MAVIVAGPKTERKMTIFFHWLARKILSFGMGRALFPIISPSPLPPFPWEGGETSEIEVFAALSAANTSISDIIPMPPERQG